MSDAYGNEKMNAKSAALEAVETHDPRFAVPQLLPAIDQEHSQMKLTHKLALTAAQAAAELDNARLGCGKCFDATKALAAALKPIATHGNPDPAIVNVFARMFAASDYDMLMRTMRAFIGQLQSPEAVSSNMLPDLRDRCIRVSCAVAHYARTWNYRRRLLAA